MMMLKKNVVLKQKPNCCIKATVFIPIALFIMLLLPVMGSSVYEESMPYDLEQGFKHPPMHARPHTWWHWMNGHVTREGITRDLEEMEQAGLGGFTLFNASEGTPEGPVKYMSDEWWELIVHTIKESDRLGLEMGIHNGAGWATTGGPWITPDKTMQEVVWTEITVKGPGIFDGYLEVPEPALGIERDMRRDPEVNKRYYVDRESLRGFYRDIVLFAFPAFKEDEQQNPYLLEDWWAKAGFARLGEYIPQSINAAGDVCIHPGEMINLTPLLDIHGRLRWEVPPGEWTLLRMGYQPTGRQNHPAPPDGRGLEVDKHSASAVEFFWKNSISKLIHASEEHAGNTFKRILIDSYEAGHQNWSHTFYRDFKQLRGYDPILYLPALTGRVVKDVETTERFLWDFRKTLNDVIVENYYGSFANLCRQSNLQFAAEGYGHYGNTSDFLASAQADIPMAEWRVFGNSPYHTVTAKMASSTAQTYDLKIVDSEAFTGSGIVIFEEHPFMFKAQGDYFFCQGITRFSYHTFAHDPYMVAPGLGLGSNGSRFDTRNTWWPYVGAYLEYVTRCQYLLQQGSAVADLLYYVGEDAPMAGTMRNDLQPIPPEGFDYFFANHEVLNRLDVKNGKLVLPEGMTYRVLVLPPHNRMSLAEIHKIQELVSKGAVVTGQRPVKTSGISGWHDEEHQMLQIATQVWGDTDGHSNTLNYYGEGRVYWGVSLSDIFEEMNLVPDFEFMVLDGDDSGETIYPGSGLEYVHQVIEKDDIYFVSNQHHHKKVVKAVFRVDGRVPELWHPESGLIEDAAMFSVLADGRMAVTLSLEPAGSVFVVFRRDLDAEDGILAVEKDGVPVYGKLIKREKDLFLNADEAGTYTLISSQNQEKQISIPTIPEAFELKGPWNVNFPEGWGAPQQITLPMLISWSDHENDGVKHFSGTATYSNGFDVGRNYMSGNHRIYLDLGMIHVIGRVILNGHDLGVVWKEPYVVDVTHAIRQGNNELEVQIANLWINRLIGDQQYPDDLTWTTNTGSTARGLGLENIPDWVANNTPRPESQRKAFTAWEWPHLETKELLPSGLIGPVRLYVEMVVEVP